MLYQTNIKLIFYFIHTINSLTPLELRKEYNKNGAVFQKTSVTNGVPNILKEMIANGKCIAQNICKFEGECCEVSYWRSGCTNTVMESSFGPGGFQTPIEDGYGEYRKCHHSWGTNNPSCLGTCVAYKDKVYATHPHILYLK